jgi:16S rRNA (uracil1498-N3)-methyltransferase
MKRVWIESLAGHVGESFRRAVVWPDDQEGHHLAVVMRARVGDEVEVFDSAGHVARGRVATVEKRRVGIEIGEVKLERMQRDVEAYCAVPKGERADWLVEKLSEVGVKRLEWLATERSVVRPEGGKFARWQKQAIAAAKQCRRVGVMRVGDRLHGLAEVMVDLRSRGVVGLVGSLRESAKPIGHVLDELSHARQHAANDRSQTQPSVSVREAILVGPEGDFSEREYEEMASFGVREVTLTETVLRVETAGLILAGSVLMRQK